YAEVGLQLENVAHGLARVFLSSKMRQCRCQAVMCRHESRVLADGLPCRNHRLVEAAETDIGSAHHCNDAELHWIKRTEAHKVLKASQGFFGIPRVEEGEPPVTPGERRIGLERDRSIHHLRSRGGIA